MLQAAIDKILLSIIADQSARHWVVIDRHHAIRFANASLLRAWDKRPDEVLGRVLPQSDLLGPVAETLTTGREIRDREIAVYSQSGRTHEWYLVDTYLFADGAGRPEYAAGVFHAVDKFAAIENQLERVNIKVIKSFVRAIGARDVFTMRHADNVSALMVGLAGYMRFSAEETTLAYLAGLVHDIGKIGIPEVILNKPSSLTAEEGAIIRRHPAIGGEILQGIDGFAALAAVTRHHHERWDGDGYPDRLTRDDIPVLSRMLAVCDAYDAMVGTRCYRTPRGARETLAEIGRCAGSQFDPIISKCFAEFVRHQEKAPLTLEPLAGR